MSLFNDKQESIFEFGMDETSKAYMLETARWGKFLAILSFVGMGLLILVGLLFLVVLNMTGETNVTTLGTGIGMSVVYFIIAAIYFYPVWALYKFSVLSKQAIHSSNQQQFNESLRYLRNIFKFLGIIMIISLVIWGLAFVIGTIGALISGT